MKTRIIKVKRTWKERWQKRRIISFWQSHKLIEVPDFEAPYKPEQAIGADDVYRGPDRVVPNLSASPHPYPQRRSVDEMYPAPVTTGYAQTIPIGRPAVIVTATEHQQPTFMENVASAALGNVVGNGISHALFDKPSESHVEASPSPREVVVNNYYGSESSRAPERSYQPEPDYRPSSSWDDNSSKSWGSEKSSDWSSSSSWGDDSSSSSSSSSDSSWGSSDSGSSWDSGSSSSSDSSWD